jgi:hypothetical protein
VCARGPACTIDDEAANVPPKLTRPKPAARPHTPESAAGIRIEPPDRQAGRQAGRQVG